MTPVQVVHDSKKMERNDREECPAFFFMDGNFGEDIRFFFQLCHVSVPNSHFCSVRGAPHLDLFSIMLLIFLDLTTN